MVLQLTGPISVGNVATEFGGTAPHSLSAEYATKIGKVAGQIIKLSDFRGKSNSITATGGSITTITGYKVHTFTSGGTFTVETGAGTIEYLVIGGGGGGGSASVAGGGGGAGEW